MAEKKQYTYIDAIRVFAIFMVIALHCICGYYNEMEHSEHLSWWLMGFVNELARTGVPLFFMISGFLLISSDTAKNPKLFYKKRFLKLLIPFLVYDILYYIYYRIVEHHQIISLDFFRELLFTGSSLHLWFVYSILVLYLFIPFIKMILDKCSFKMMIFFFILVIFQTTIKPFINIAANGVIEVVLTEDGIFGYMGYMILGYILGTFDFKKSVNIIIYIAGIASFFGFAVMNSVIAYKTWNIVFNGGYMINHYLEAAALFILFKNHKYIHGTRLLKKLASLCMTVYFVHIFAFELMHFCFHNLPMREFYPILYVGTSVLSFGAAFVIEKIKSANKRLNTVST